MSKQCYKFRYCETLTRIIHHNRNGRKGDVHCTLHLFGGNLATKRGKCHYIARFPARQHSYIYQFSGGNGILLYSHFNGGKMARGKWHQATPVFSSKFHYVTQFSLDCSRISTFQAVTSEGNKQLIKNLDKQKKKGSLVYGYV